MQLLYTQNHASSPHTKSRNLLTSDSSDSGDSSDSSDSNDSNDSCDQTNLYTKNLNLPKTYLPTCLCDSSDSSDSSESSNSSDSSDKSNQKYFLSQKKLFTQINFFATKKISPKKISQNLFCQKKLPHFFSLTIFFFLQKTNFNKKTVFTRFFSLLKIKQPLQKKTTQPPEK